MKKASIRNLLLLNLLGVFFSLSSFAQKSETGPAHTYLANYYSVINNICDSRFSISDRKLFRAELLDRYFLKESSLIYNDLNAEGSSLLKAEEYLDHLIVKNKNDLKITYEILKIGELDISRTPMKMTCHIVQVISCKGKPDIKTELDFLLEIDYISNNQNLLGRIKSININEEYRKRLEAERADTDKDGVLDKDDECPNLKGEKELNGCPDSDRDGIADHLDKCPQVKGFSRYKGCPIPDSDNDGFNDEVDECPEVKGISKYNGCPIPDSDNDGFNDEVDECPNTSGTVKGCLDTDGDGFADKNDECPKIFGTIHGCPETVGDNDFNDDASKLDVADEDALNDQRAEYYRKQKEKRDLDRLYIGISLASYLEKNNTFYRINGGVALCVRLGYQINTKIGTYFTTGRELEFAYGWIYGFGGMYKINASLELGLGYINKGTRGFDKNVPSFQNDRLSGIQIDAGYYINQVKLHGGVNYFPNSFVGSSIFSNHIGFEFGIGYRI